MPCGHSFHLNCFNVAVNSMNRCPNCRDNPIENEKFWADIFKIKELLTKYQTSEEMVRINKIQECAQSTISAINNRC